MASYAFASGLPVPASVLGAIEATDLGEDAQLARLSEAYEQLVRIIAPVRPSLVVAFGEGTHGGSPHRMLGRVRIVRYQMLLALVSLVCFIGLSLTEYVNHPINGNIFESSGIPLLICELFYLSAAGLGASFAGLFHVDREISAGTFDPRHQASYWMRFLLGLIAGLLLATLIDTHAGASSAAAGTPSGLQFSQAALALLGGFSSSVVFRILSRMVETLETMVRGNLDDVTLAKQQAGEARLGQQLVQERTKLIERLAQLRQDVVANPDPKRVGAQLEALSHGLLAGGLGSGPSTASPGSAPGSPAPDPGILAPIPGGPAPAEVSPPPALETGGEPGGEAGRAPGG
jgi:hypothetical protein